jgi:hypothetical protein
MKSADFRYSNLSNLARAGFETVMSSKADVCRALPFKLMFFCRSTAEAWPRCAAHIAGAC